MPCSETNAAAETTDNRTTMPPIVDTPPKRAPRFDYIVMLCVIGAFLVAGGLITNSSRIMDVLWLMRTDNAAAITPPHLPVTLRNSGTETISLPVKGLCLLWPPSALAFVFRRPLGFAADFLDFPTQADELLDIGVACYAIADRGVLGEHRITGDKQEEKCKEANGAQ